MVASLRCHFYAAYLLCTDFLELFPCVYFGQLLLANPHAQNIEKDIIPKSEAITIPIYTCLEKTNNNVKAITPGGQFVAFLQYKLAEQGKTLVKVDKWFPSSKTCSVCGAKKDELSLSERIYICECGNAMNRDVNAAVNIKHEAMRMLGIV